VQIKAKKTAIVAAVALAGSLLSAAPAMAEGSWSSYITRAIAGFQSRSWQDNNIDNISTSVQFSGCSLEGGVAFEKTQLEMWGEFGAFPDQNLGNIQNYCGTSSWGRVASNSYHFRINTINGVTNAYWLNVNSVVVKY